VNVGLVDCYNHIAYATVVVDKKDNNENKIINTDFSLQIRNDPGF